MLPWKHTLLRFSVRDSIFKLLRSRGIDSKELEPAANVATGTETLSTEVQTVQYIKLYIVDEIVEMMQVTN
jgi:hypothetical protein